MFPKELRFNIHPRELQSAVELLPDLKGQARLSVSASEELKNKLLQVPIEKLKLWKMKPKMLSKLPYLIVGEQNKDLQERILAISIASMENCTEDILVLLLSHLYQEKDFIQAMNARFVKVPPQKNLWLKKYYKAFRSKKPASHLAEMLQSETDVITQLNQLLRIPSFSPLFEAIYMHYAKDYDWKTIKKMAFPSLLSFLNGGAPLKVKQKVLFEVLKEYCNQEYSISVLQIGSPLRVLIEKTLPIFGSFSNPMWKSLPEVKKLAKILFLENKLEKYFGFGDSFSRLRWWRRWIQSVDEIIIHRPSSLICLYLKDFIIVESLAVAQWVYIYDRQEFMIHIQPKLWERSPFQIALSGENIERKEGWQEHMNQWMLQKGFQKGEEW